MDLGRLHAVFVLHHAAHPDHRRDLVFRQADALAAKVGGRANAGIGAHVDAGVPEQPRHEGGNADIGRGPGSDRADIARERQLGDVEFLIAEGAKENLLRIERQVGDRAALHLNAAVPDRAGAVVIAARNGNRHLDHRASSSVCAVGWSRAGKRKLELRKSYLLAFAAVKAVVAGFRCARARLLRPAFARYFEATRLRAGGERHPPEENDP